MSFLGLAQILTAFQLKRYLPEIDERLRAYTSILPLFEPSPMSPFGGFVLNISACTPAHKDKWDKDICVLIFFGEWTGGQICLYEAGLVLEVEDGDVLIFPSGRITHFNLHYSGVRMSVVLHSDSAGDSWTENLNGWKDHVANV